MSNLTHSAPNPAPSTPTYEPTGALARYSWGVWEGLYTAFVGLGVTFKSFWKKPATVQYPDVDMMQPYASNAQVVDAGGHVRLNTTIADRYRGLLHVDLDLCTSCGNCQEACPILCIEVDGLKIEGHKGKRPYFFNIDMAKCMYCGLCVDPCPTNAIQFSRVFERATRRQEELFLVFVDAQERERVQRMAAELEAAKAAAKAAKPKEEKPAGEAAGGN